MGVIAVNYLTLDLVEAHLARRLAEGVKLDISDLKLIERVTVEKWEMGGESPQLIEVLRREHVSPLFS